MWASGSALRLGAKDASYFSSVFGYINPKKTKEEEIQPPPLSGGG